MCGIGGWVAFGTARPEPGSINSVLEILEKRGRDASGVAFGSWGERCGYVKNAVPASELFSQEQTAKYLPGAESSAVCIMHARAQTKGDKNKLENDHPVFQKGGKYILVHNGVVDNDDELFHEKCDLNLAKRQAEVDTEALVALLNKADDPESALDNLKFAVGSAAIAALPMTKLDHVLFFRRTSPLQMIYDSERDILFFGSTSESLGPYFDWCPKAAKRGIKQLAAAEDWELQANTGLVVVEGGIQKIKEVKTEYKYHVGKFCRGAWWERDDNRHHPHPLALVDSSTAQVKEPIFRTLKVNFKDPAAGRIHDNKVVLSVAKGFIGIPAFGTQLSMRTLPNKAFPILKEDTPHVHLKCPACWTLVKARELFERTFNCPRCETDIDKPSVFRILTDGELRTLQFREGV